MATTTLFAQQTKVVAQVPPAVTAKVVPVVSTKELKKQLKRNFKRKKYKAVSVTNPKVDMDNGVSFKYKMTGDVGINGVVNISKDAIDTAHIQMKRFSNGNKDLTTETPVWISNAVFNELKTKGESFMQASVFSAQVFQVITDEDLFYMVKVDDQDKYIK